MAWFSKSPFGPGQDPLDHMLRTLSLEAEAAGIPINDSEKKMLAADAVPGEPLPEDFKVRLTPLIVAILKRERAAGSDDPNAICFGSALEWVEPDYPNIAALAEEVIMDGGLGALPQLHGRRLIRDRAQLAGCAVVLFVALLAIAITAVRIFH